MNPKVFIFFGRSGCGKGTQAKLLSDYLKAEGRSVLYVETGSALRALAKREDLTGKNTHNLLKDGHLIPIFLPIWIWTDFLLKNFTGNEDMILDGVCRRRDEAEALDSAIEFYGIKNPTVILMDVSRQWSFDRLIARKRADDTPEKINNRLGWFEKDVVPSIEYFKNKAEYNFIEVNGEQSIENVHKEIMNKLGLA